MVKYFFEILILIICFFSCGKEDRFCRKKKESQILHINFIYSPFTVDPRKGTDPVTTVTNYMFYEGLTRLESDGTVKPALAERIKISRNRKKYTFFLKKSMWSDGSPLTAYHFEMSWKKALNPGFSSSSAHLLFPIKNAAEAKMGKCSLDEVGVEAISEQVLLVRLKRPTPYFLELIAYPTYFPVPYNGDEVPHPNQQSNILTNGPFTIGDWKHDDEIIAIKNPYYWNANKVKLEEIHAMIISDETTALKLFDRGHLDYNGGLISPLPIDAMPTLKQTKHLRQKPIAGTTFSVFNLNKFPFNNIHIRKAFAYAINKKDIISHVAQMFDDPAVGLVPPVLKNIPAVLDNDYGYNQDVALNHFEIGLQQLEITREEFPVITYSFFNSELQRNLALALQDQWKEALGVTVKLEGKELKSHIANLHAHQFQISQMSWIGQYYDRMSFLERFTNNNGYCNYCGWENPFYRHLIEDSFYRENKARFFLLDEAEKMIIDDMPILPILHFHAVYIKNPRLKGLVISPMGDIQFHKAFFD